MLRNEKSPLLLPPNRLLIIKGLGKRGLVGVYYLKENSYTGIGIVGSRPTCVKQLKNGVLEFYSPFHPYLMEVVVAAIKTLGVSIFKILPSSIYLSPYIFPKGHL